MTETSVSGRNRGWFKLLEDLLDCIAFLKTNEEPGGATISWSRKGQYNYDCRVQLWCFKRERKSVSRQLQVCVCVCVGICANSHGDKASVISKAKSLTFPVNIVAFLSLFIWVIKKLLRLYLFLLIGAEPSKVHLYTISTINRRILAHFYGQMWYNAPSKVI